MGFGKREEDKRLLEPEKNKNKNQDSKRKRDEKIWDKNKKKPKNLESTTCSFHNNPMTKSFVM